MVFQQFCHAQHQRGNQKGGIATNGKRSVDMGFQRFQAGAKPFQRTLPLAAVMREENRFRNFWQRLLRGRDHDDGRYPSDHYPVTATFIWPLTGTAGGR